MRRFTLSILVVVGVGLIVAPFALSMFSRSHKGAAMVNDFRPIMQPANVTTTPTTTTARSSSCARSRSR